MIFQIRHADNYSPKYIPSFLWRINNMWQSAFSQDLSKLFWVKLVDMILPDYTPLTDPV